MSSDGDVDYSGYSLQQVNEALQSIDRVRFPRNFEKLTRRLQELQSMSMISQPDTRAPGIVTYTVTRLKTGSVFRLVAAGTFFSLVPFCILLGLLALFGRELIRFNDESVVGLQGLIVSPLLGIFSAIVCTAFIGVMLAFGLWLYSKWKPLTLEAVPIEVANDKSAT